MLSSLTNALSDEAQVVLEKWRNIYGRSLQTLTSDELDGICQMLAQHNPDIVPVRPEIEAIWEPITLQDDWQPFYDLLKRIQQSVETYGSAIK